MLKELMMKINLLLFTLLGTALAGSAYGQHDNNSVDKTAQKVWVDAATERLNSYDTNALPPEITFYESNRGYDAVLACRVINEGFIRFGETNWLRIITHSAHDDPAIGDIVLALNQAHDLFYNETHVCGGLALFLGYDMKLPDTDIEFFSRFAGERRNSLWKRLADQSPINLKP